MPSVSNLGLRLQVGSENTYFATWKFEESVKKKSGGSSTSAIKNSDWVTIKSGATYYNGVSIPSWVMSDTWKVVQITKGDRAVLGTNKSGTHNIQSAISTKYLNTGSTTRSSSSGTSTKASNDVVKYLDHYLVKWYYATDDGVWFISNENGTEVKEKQATYNGPSNATKIKVSVKPVSKTYKSNNTDVSYWTGTWVSAEWETEKNYPEVPDTPTVSVENLKLTASNTNIDDSRTDQIEYELYMGAALLNGKKSMYYPRGVPVLNCRASIQFNLSPGCIYQVRCRAVNNYASTRLYKYSDWSPFTEDIYTIPETPTNIKELKALSESSVKISWDSVESATGYEIEYTTKKIYFDSASSEVKSTTVTDAVNYAIVTGMTSGEEYFFRLRATNKAGNSGWTKIKSIAIGEPPAAPTTWSSTTTAITGNPVTLYWVHNAEDDSDQTYATLELYIDNSTTPVTYTFDNNNTIENDALSYVPLTEEDRDDGKVNSCTLKTSNYNEGTSIKWRVRTAGVTEEYGDWSIQRDITVYAPPTLELSATDVDGNSIETLTSFPFYINAVSGPKTQAPIGYHVNISSNERYETIDNMGNPKIVNNGENVYSEYFDITDPLLLKMTPNIVNLENNISYTLTCIVSMNSGLTAEESLVFDTSWSAVAYEADIEIGIDTDIYSAYISPYCLDAEGNNITDVSLSVYRREFDGSFTEIATGVDTDMNEYIIDPHPSLDYARYRVVATSKTTGSISYYDPPGQPVGGKEVIIQWDELWTNFDTNDEEELESPPWSGSMLKLPYNIDISESNSSDVSLIEYTGRKHPVSYYGTQLGYSATWNLEIQKDDKETLYGLRRLSKWMGDVYVREPSGSGYWANIAVSFSQKHCELTIPVTFNISQVEGGM